MVPPDARSRASSSNATAGARARPAGVAFTRTRCACGSQSADFVARSSRCSTRPSERRSTQLGRPAMFSASFPASGEKRLPSKSASGVSTGSRASRSKARSARPSCSAVSVQLKVSGGESRKVHAPEATSSAAARVRCFRSSGSETTATTLPATSAAQTIPPCPGPGRDRHAFSNSSTFSPGTATAPRPAASAPPSGSAISRGRE